ncbi:Yip1 domain protein [uncultured archaeon]|nr:Yip1 domain protein [uncultured archaeon]
MDFGSIPQISQHILLKPAQTLAAQAKAKAALADGVILYTAASLLGVLSGLLSLVFLDSQSSRLLYQGQMGSLFSNPLLYALVGLAAGLATSFIWAGLVHFLSKLLGGKGRFHALYFLFALIALPIAVLHLLNALPYLGLLLGALASLYGLYLQVLAVSRVHRLTTLRAGLAVLAALVLCGLAISVLVFLSLGPMA